MLKSDFDALLRRLRDRPGVLPALRRGVLPALRRGVLPALRRGELDALRFCDLATWLLTRERRDSGSSMPLKVKVEEPAVRWKSIDERDDLREGGERGDAG